MNVPAVPNRYSQIRKRQAWQQYVLRTSDPGRATTTHVRQRRQQPVAYPSHPLVSFMSVDVKSRARAPALPEYGCGGCGGPRGSFSLRLAIA